MRYLEVIFYNISYDIKNSLPDTRILYILAQTESFFFVKYITESVLRFRIIPFFPFTTSFLFSSLYSLGLLPVLALNTLEKASGSPYPTLAATSLT